MTDSEIEGRLNQNPIGTRLSGYAPPSDGPFRCSNCIHFEADESSCNHRVVMADKQLKKNDEGEGIVQPGGCCMYFRNNGKSKHLLLILAHRDSK